MVKKTQQQERIFSSVLPQAVDRLVERGERSEHDQQLQHQHADAGDVIRELLDEDGGQTLER
ncbi:hypothetical protein [Bradyrhizobium sp. RDM4]|uniref:hypothetical protein n=1 Tax=Bradyrhizobium sp. RDM4 TaxID=3378765 RepID=UPI0038FC443F